MTKQELITILNEAYRRGFDQSEEGYNAEYPFADNAQKPEEDEDWIEKRDQEIAKLFSND